MIDFRYHLVSLVAVFIALAVGIVLGAGPLREGLSSTLEGEVAQLREERADLRAEVEAANQRAGAREGALERLSGRAVTGTLQDVRVGVVVLPGADRNLLEELEREIDRAGGDVALTAEVSEEWSAPDPDQALLDSLALTLDVPQPRTGTAPTTATVLAAALAGADRPGQVGAWVGAGQELEDAGLVELTWRGDGAPEFTDRRPPQAVLVVGGDVDAAQAQEPEGARVLDVRLDLVGGLAELDVPLVVAGEGAETRPTEDLDTLDPLVAAVRDDRGLAGRVSTVDNVEHLSGRIATALALAWEVLEDSGHYGLGRLAEAPVPPVPPVREPVGVGMPELPGVDGGADTAATATDEAADAAQTTSAP